MRKPELLLPAGNPACLRTAVRYGADAVYLGGEAFSLRAGASNFTKDEMREGISFAHAHAVKVYVTANIFAHENDLAQAEEYFAELAELRPDAVLISDPGLFTLAKEVCPQIPVHISTQLNTTNARSCRFWQELGAERIVLARELSLKEIRSIADALPEGFMLEAFVHGAMCISYSGRCLLSSYLTGRDANRGACTHPCRWRYSIVEETRPGEVMPVFENERGTFFFSSRDLCMITHLPDLLEAGIGSLKIEGRMKTPLYVATCARAYRLAIDTLLSDPASYEAQKEHFLAMVSEGTIRRFGTGFYYGRPDAEGQIYDEETYIKNYTFLGIIEGTDAQGRAVLTQKNKFSVGDRIELMKTNGENCPFTVTSIEDAEGNSITSAPHPKMELHIPVPFPFEEGELLRMPS